jgi:hypothetical protein
MRNRPLVPITVLVLLLAAASTAHGQPAQSSDRLWVYRGRGSLEAGAATAPRVAQAQANRSITSRLRAFARFSGDDALVRAVLNRAPRESARGAAPLIFSVPLPDGDFERVRVEESPIFSPELQAQNDTIRTYTARGVDDPTLTGRLDYTSLGFHGMLLSTRGSVFVDPIGGGEYASYWKKDAIGEPFVCDTHEKDMQPTAAGDESPSGIQSLAPILLALNPSGGQLRTYRLAVSVTGEYTEYFDGTPPTAGTPNTSAQIATTINRVTGVYEREVQIRLQLTTTRIFTDPDTDPFSSGDFRSENQTTLDANPGDANYDIGHIFSQGGSGGVATGSVVCVTGSKARGFTSRVNPTGDAFDIDYVAHEIGHQFSGSHTWTSNNGSCSDAGQFQAASSYEAGSGTTIMAYAGICAPDNVQANSDAYFHTRSYDQIVQYRTSGSGNSCGTASNTGNSPPTINAGADCTVPRNTPFTLTASGSDPDGDSLTYLWEQFDLGTHGQIPAPGNTTGPMFRSRPASASPSRTFPQFADILSGAATPWEVLPNVDRTLNFRVTARDNRAGGGGVDYDSTVVTVSGDPFTFTAPTTGSSLECGGSSTVTWNVGGGSIASNVGIELSTNGGTAFSSLVGSTANDGSESVTVPRTLTAQGRMKLVPPNQCFFALSKSFSIVDTLAPSITAPADIVAECTGPTGTSVSLGTATASDQCDLSPAISNNAPTTFTLGTTQVLWTATDDSSHQGTDAQTVTIQDTTPPVISCNTPTSIVPSDAPVTFTATAADVCDASVPAQVVSYRCFATNGGGKEISKATSCVVQVSGDSLTIVDSGGINNVVEWLVRATDDSGNTGTATCSVPIVKKK